MVLDNQSMFQRTRMGTSKLQQEVSSYHNTQFSNDTNEDQGLVLEDNIRLASILDLQQSDEEFLLHYHGDPQSRFIQNLLQDEEKFIHTLQTSGHQKISVIFERLRKISQEHSVYFTMILRLKQLLKSSIVLSQSKTFDESLMNIIQTATQCLECDRASCFLLDESKGELWSKVAKGVSGIIRFPADQGIAGQVAQYKHVLNIQNAYADKRFNEEIDLQTNYKTQTVLCAPILNGSKCLGVLQCINKLKGIFTKEDEYLCNMFCTIARVIIERAISQDEQQKTISKLRQALRAGISIKEQTPQELVDKLLLGEQLLKTIMNVDLVRIVRVLDDKMHYVDDQRQIKVIEGYHGILGKTIEFQKSRVVPNCYSNALYSPLVDLQTTMPVASVPIINEGHCIGAMMITYLRGLQGVLASKEPIIQPLDEEVLKQFCQQLAQIL